jgi:D-beta-D-heptose 7-phosphate kinase / D-beta-D-heptose 1-phosphate adenosyltransferase
MLVFTNGCFDIIHRGHVELLAYCKSLGDVIVGLNSDESIRRLKGDGRPMNSESDRKQVLEALRYVDQVIIFEEDTPYNLIREITPDLIVKGGDYAPKDVVGGDLCKVQIFETVDGYSTTDIIHRIRSR